MEDLFDDFVPPSDDERESYVVTDEPHANRMTRHWRRLRNEIAEIDKIRDAEIERINKIYADRVAGADRDVEWIGGQLKSWMRELLRLQPIDRTTGRPKGPKTLELVGAVVKANSRGGQPVIRDREAFQEWCIENESFDRGAKASAPWELLALASAQLHRMATWAPAGSADHALAERFADQLDAICEAQMSLTIPTRGGEAPVMRWSQPAPPPEGEEPAEGYWVNLATGEAIPGLAREEPGYNYVVHPEA